MLQSVRLSSDSGRVNETFIYDALKVMEVAGF